MNKKEDPKASPFLSLLLPPDGPATCSSSSPQQACTLTNGHGRNFEDTSACCRHALATVSRVSLATDPVCGLHAATGQASPLQGPQEGPPVSLQLHSFSLRLLSFSPDKTPTRRQPCFSLASSSSAATSNVNCC
ncbi:MAG: hypothetical protein Q8P67_15500 [archaeon]|nr:hypothetical protein [archaeon]